MSISMIRFIATRIWLLFPLLISCASGESPAPSPVVELDTQTVIELADQYLHKEPITITAFVAERSGGGKHDYYSEGSYWWPDPENPDGPYIRKDGQRNPANFKAHKKAMNEMAEWVSTLTAAYLLTEDKKYALHAIRHLQAWFAEPATRMNPSLLYAQAIKGISTGRGIGIIDTVCLIDVALSICHLQAAGFLEGAAGEVVQQWFSAYGDWLTTHPYGVEERDHGNNHSSWWGAQLAAYARVAARPDLLAASQEVFKQQLAVQMMEDGRFPKELERTKPFHYTIYNLNAWAIFCQLASTPEENLWDYQAQPGSLATAVNFVLRYYKQPSAWPYATDLEPAIMLHQNDYLYFAGKALDREDILVLWRELSPKKHDHHADLVLWKNLEFPLASL